MIACSVDDNVGFANDDVGCCGAADCCDCIDDGGATAAAGVDTGDVAASVLTEDGHSKKTYFLGGYDYTLNDFSNKISDELGKKIPFVEIPIENAVAVMKDKGMPDWLIDHQVTLMGLVSSGVAAGANANIENISGHRARSLANFVKDNINIFKG